MTPAEWLAAAMADADRRGLPELKPLLEMLAGATRTLRTAEWNLHAGDRADADRGCPDDNAVA